MTTISDRPDWVSDMTVTPPATDPKPRRSRASIITIVALAVALALTLALAIVATLDMENDLDSARAELSDAKSTISDLEQDVTDITAQADLADEAYNQEAWRAEQCEIAADASISLNMAWSELFDGDVDAANGWGDDAATILDRGGYYDVSEAWDACTNLY